MLIRTPVARRVASGRHPSRAGITLLEAVLAIGVMTVAVGLFSSMVVSTSRQRSSNHEYPVASEAVRTLLEGMRNQEFAQVFAQYNDNPQDDPGGPGSAPGHRFAIEGLDPLPTSPDGFVAEVFFPTFVPVGETVQLREDVQEASLGMPRDLSGDSIIDAEDHADDYVLLPVRVEVDWSGRYGARHLEIYTMLTEFRK